MPLDSISQEAPGDSRGQWEQRIRLAKLSKFWKRWFSLESLRSIWVAFINSQDWSAAKWIPPRFQEYSRGRRDNLLGDITCGNFRMCMLKLMQHGLCTSASPYTSISPIERAGRGQFLRRMVALKSTISFQVSIPMRWLCDIRHQFL